MTETVFTQDVTNHLCPDFSSHHQNAAERYFAPHPVPDTLHAGECDAIDADAEREYLACEGHI